MVLSVLTDGIGCSAANQRRTVSADRAGERADHRGAPDHVQLHEQQGARWTREVRVRSSQGALVSTDYMTQSYGALVSTDYITQS